MRCSLSAITPRPAATTTRCGIGPSSVSLAPGLALKEIRAGALRALKGNRAACRITLPERFTLEIKYTTPIDAYRASWYPGARLAEARVVRFESADYFEILRAIKFMA